jgi:ferredoxin-NADP reductase
VGGRRDVAEGVVELTLVPRSPEFLLPWEPGAHIDLILPSGRVRQYSLCGEPSDGHYRIAVLREISGRGGSAEVHDMITTEAQVQVRGPRNAFRLVEADAYLFIAGGIGITPLIPMIRQVERAGGTWRLLYGGRTRSSMAYVDDLVILGHDRVDVVPQEDHGHPDLAGALAGLGPRAAVYCCGPTGLIGAVESAVADLPTGPRLFFERFTADQDRVEPVPEDARPFDVELRLSGTTVHVGVDQTVLDAVRTVLPGLAFDCMGGYCGSCETAVLGGTPEHRDRVLTDEERERSKSMMICVSRCRDGNLVLDL